MTLVKKTKKPKAKKAGKKPVKKPITVFSGAKGGASVEKIDARLKPTPEPKLVKIDPMLRNPLKIVDVPRSQIYPYQQTPTYMFSGQDAGNLNRQLDVLSSREQQLEGKFLDLKNELEKEKKEKKDLEHFSQIQDLGQRIENYKNNVGNEDIVEINQEIKQLLKDRTLNPTNHDLLIDMRLYAKENIKKDVETIFKEVKSTNTLLDDVIHENNLVDEAQVIIDEMKSTNVKAPVNLPSFEAIELLNEMKSTNVKGPIILPTLEEAVTINKKPRGRPKKNAPKIDELVEVKQTNTLLDDKIINNILDDVSATVGEPVKMHYNFKTGMSEKVIIPENEDDYEYSIGTGKYTLKSQSPNYYLDEKTGNYEPKSENRKYEFVILGGEPQYKLREHYVDPSTYRNIPSTFNKSESGGLLN